MIIERYAHQIKEVTLTDCRITVEEFAAVVRYDAKVLLSEEYRQRICHSRAKLEEMLAEDAGIYGVNTGFGDNVRYRISEADMDQLQVNILRSHGCSVGRPLERDQVRAMLLMLLINIGKGYSAVRLEVLELIREFLNQNITPYVPGEGSIGGLSYPPYLSMTLMGEGRIYEGGKICPAAEVLQKKGLQPIQFKSREGLAMLSNAGWSLGPALLALYDSIIILRHADVCGALVCEALQSTDKAYDARLMELKGHPEQVATAEYLRKLLNGSQIMKNSRNRNVQDSTNTRLIPHIHGAVKRMIIQAHQALMEELYAVNDNPVFLPDGTALMGSNWDATYIALSCDTLAIGAVSLAKLMETHMERLVDAHLSGLPPFLVRNPGLNNGFMIVQYVTAGLLGDICLLSAPATSFHATVSAGQESPITRDDASANKLLQITEKLCNMVALTMMTALQAVDFIDLSLSPVMQLVHDEVRRTVSFMENDDMIYLRIEAMEEIIHNATILEIVQQELGEFTI